MLNYHHKQTNKQTNLPLASGSLHCPDRALVTVPTHSDIVSCSSLWSEKRMVLYSTEEDLQKSMLWSDQAGIEMYINHYV